LTGPERFFVGRCDGRRLHGRRPGAAAVGSRCRGRGRARTLRQLPIFNSRKVSGAGRRERGPGTATCSCWETGALGRPCVARRLRPKGGRPIGVRGVRRRRNPKNFGVLQRSFARLRIGRRPARSLRGFGERAGPVRSLGGADRDGSVRNKRGGGRGANNAGSTNELAPLERGGVFAARDPRVMGRTRCFDEVRGTGRGPICVFLRALTGKRPARLKGAGPRRTPVCAPPRFPRQIKDALRSSRVRHSRPHA